MHIKMNLTGAITCGEDVVLVCDLTIERDLGEIMDAIKEGGAELLADFLLSASGVKLAATRLVMNSKEGGYRDTTDEELAEVLVDKLTKHNAHHAARAIIGGAGIMREVGASEGAFKVDSVSGGVEVTLS